MRVESLVLNLKQILGNVGGTVIDHGELVQRRSFVYNIYRHRAGFANVCAVTNACFPHFKDCVP